MKMQDVRARARSFGINTFGKTKAAVILEIQRQEGNPQCFGSAIGGCDQHACCWRSVCLG